jgi:hypothetical protein
MRERSQTSPDFKANIKQGRANLLAMFRQLAEWRRFNEQATSQLKAASKLDISRGDPWE